MDNNILFGLLGVALLLGGLFIGAAFFSTQTEVDVPGETVQVPVQDNLDRIAELEAELEEEVEVLVEDTTLEDALDVFMLAVEEEEDEAGNDIELLECGGDDYDFDEISVSKVYNDWSVSYDGDETEVDFEVKLKYKETDERSCRDTFDVTVLYEDDEDTIVRV